MWRWIICCSGNLAKKHALWLQIFSSPKCTKCFSIDKMNNQTLTLKHTMFMPIKKVSFGLTMYTFSTFLGTSKKILKTGILFMLMQKLLLGQLWDLIFVLLNNIVINTFNKVILTYMHKMWDWSFKNEELQLLLWTNKKVQNFEPNKINRKKCQGLFKLMIMHICDCFLCFFNFPLVNNDL